MSVASAAVVKRCFSKQDFFRYCRLVHGWLSAFSFLILCLFAFTGLLLNHPDWPLAKAPKPIEASFALTQEQIAQLADSEEPERLLVELAAAHVALRGEMTGGNEVGNEIFVRMQGVRGLTDIRANLVTGNVSVVVEPAPAISILNELHRGERAGTAWRFLIDIVAVLLIVLSVVGYCIFLSLKFRLRTAILLTIASAAGLWGLFVVAVA
ncbi:MAG TPA: PepSY-associated TM helix domain-containing protein [Steroidobacteraceae bacterium]